MNINFNNVGDAYGFNDVKLSYIYGSGDYLLWPVEQPDPSDYVNQYLTFEITQGDGGTLYWLWDSYNSDGTPFSTCPAPIEYNKNNGGWTDIADSSYAITVHVGDIIKFRGNNTRFWHNYELYGMPPEGQSKWACWFAAASGILVKMNIYGNISSIINKTSFASDYQMHYESTFRGLFTQLSGLEDASNLILPKNGLSNHCFDSLFANCGRLKYPPMLNATSLANYCYAEMFSSCTSLTTAPVLPATTLVTGCYANMFSGCNSLTTIPSLPATTLAPNCYRYMFSGCNSLTTVDSLPATTLVTGCYYGMFYACENINRITCLAIDISATDCLFGWVERVSHTGTFTKKSGVTWPSGDSGIPTGWTVVNQN